MIATIQNGYGTITISHHVLAMLAGDAAMHCYGVVGLASKSARDGFIAIVVKDSMTRGIKVEVSEDGLTLILHVILQYGINIKTASRSIIENVRYQVERHTGLTVKDVQINVESVRL